VFLLCPYSKNRLLGNCLLNNCDGEVVTISILIILTHYPFKQMYDFSNPYLTEQTKQDILALEVDKEYQNEKYEQQKKGNPFGSSSYWVVTVRDLITLNNSSIESEHFFNISENLLREMSPDMDVILMEHDNIKRGEYDNFLCKWSTKSYINCCAIGVAGKVCGELPVTEDGGLPLAYYVLTPEGREDYPFNAEKEDNNQPIWGIGLVDIPTEILDLYEAYRVHKQTYCFSYVFEQMMDKRLNKHQLINGKAKTTFNPKKKRFNKGFGK